MSSFLCRITIVLCLSLPAISLGEEAFTLEESASSGVVYEVQCEVDVRGKLKTAIDKKKTLDLDLKVEAALDYRERRLPGAGRDAASLRALRQYREAKSAVSVGSNQGYSPPLDTTDPLIVAHGKRDGIVFYRPAKTMSRAELLLLQTPGDGLAVLGLLPEGKIQAGQKWTVENWAAQMLTGTEALLKTSVACELESVKSGVAKVLVAGKVEGAVQGATTEIELSGHYLFDTKDNYLRSVELEQTEKRSVGAVSPGLDVVANVKLVRSPVKNQGRLTEAAANQIPLEPKPEQLALVQELPWNASISHSRDWHLFMQLKGRVVLRLIKGGGLIAQCDLTPLKEGENLGESEFRELVKKGLGKSLKTIVSSHSLSDENDEVSLRRIIAEGESQNIKMTWHYYLATAEGRQMIFFVAFETDLKDKLGDEDLELVKSLKLQQPTLVPAGGEK